MKKETTSVRNSLLLLLTATIWGVAFVAQSVSMDYIGGFTFNAIRNLMGSVTLSSGYSAGQNPPGQRLKLPRQSAKPYSPEASAVVFCSALQAIFSSLESNIPPLEKPVLSLPVTSSSFPYSGSF